MFLRKVALLNYKNHENAEFAFSKKINCLIGKNGVGKTNLLDAVYFLCLTKSYLSSSDIQNIKMGKDFFRIDGEFTTENSSLIVTYKMPQGKRKELLVDEIPVQLVSKHIGVLPCIIVSPADSQLVTGNSDERRKFLDVTISQINHDYLEWLMIYNRILAQRNAMLKQFAETGKTDYQLLETYDMQLVPLGNKIVAVRKQLVEQLQPAFQRYYKLISMERENVAFSYQTQLHETDFGTLLKNNVKRDLILQRTETGIHRDDLEFTIEPDTDSEKASEYAGKVKRFGSQGQQKSFILALKLAQYDLIKNGCNKTPLLLIDDIFDKLDSDRSRKLVETIASDDFGQVFITDTDEANIQTALQGQEELFDILKIEKVTETYNV